MRLIGITLLLALTTIVSACGGGGGGSSTDTSTGSSAGTSTTSTTDAEAQEIVTGFLKQASSQASALSTAMGAASTTVNTRIDITPVFNGTPSIDTLTGVTLHYDNHTVSGAYGGSTVLNGNIVGTGNGSGADAQSEGLTRTFVSLFSESGVWAFDGVLDVNVVGSGYAGSPPFLIGSITDTLDAGDEMLATNTENGDVYVFDDIRIQINISGAGSSGNVSCSQTPASFILLHKQGSSSIMSCTLNSDCSGCI